MLLLTLGKEGSLKTRKKLIMIMMVNIVRRNHQYYNHHHLNIIKSVSNYISILVTNVSLIEMNQFIPPIVEKTQKEQGTNIL